MRVRGVPRADVREFGAGTLTAVFRLGPFRLKQYRGTTLAFCFVAHLTGKLPSHFSGYALISAGQNFSPQSLQRFWKIVFERAANHEARHWHAEADAHIIG